MRKIFSIFAAALIAFSFASCDKKGGNTPSDPAEKEQKDTIVIPPIPESLKFTIAISDITEISAHVVITPSIDTVKYIYTWAEKKILIDADGNVGNINAAVQDYWDVVAGNGTTYAQYLQVAVSGKYEADFSLTPNTEYFVCVYQLDSNLIIVNDYVEVEFFTTLEEESYGVDGFVDLGLPSGNLWKKESESVQWNTYDKVISEYGDAVPSQVQWEELINNCTWTYNADQGAYIIQGKNGNTISMACAGYRDCSEGGHYKQTEGWYWTSTATDEDNAYAAFFTHYETYDNITTDELPRCNGFSVHLIYVEK